MRKYLVKGHELVSDFKKIFLFGLIVFSVGISACGTNNEGCLDANASNFDVSADVNCCCVYPKMGITFLFKNGSNDFSKSVPFFDAAGDSFLIGDVKFFVSDIHWTLEDDMKLRSDTRVWLYPALDQGKDSIRSIDDYYLIDLSRNTLSNFTFLKPIQLKNLKFLLGVADSALTNLPQFMKNIAHPLADNGQDSMYNEANKMYMTMRIEIKNHNNLGISDTLYLQGPDAREHFEYSINQQIKLGFDNNIIIPVQLKRLFEGIRIKEETDDVILEKLKANTKNIFN